MADSGTIDINIEGLVAEADALDRKEGNLGADDFTPLVETAASQANVEAMRSVVYSFAGMVVSLAFMAWQMGNPYAIPTPEEKHQAAELVATMILAGEVQRLPAWLEAYIPYITGFMGLGMIAKTVSSRAAELKQQADNAGQGGQGTEGAASA